MVEVSTPNFAVAPAGTQAHFKLMEPASWLIEDDRGDPQKSGPCGGSNTDYGKPSYLVNQAKGGEITASGPERSRSIIAQFIKKQQRAGRLRRSDPHQSATLFHDMIIFDLLHRAMLGDKPSDDEIRHRVDTTIDAFLHGFEWK